MFYACMDIKFNSIKFHSGLNTNIPGTHINFKALPDLKPDTFEKSSKVQCFDMSVYDPVTNTNSRGRVEVDLAKPQKIVIGRKKLLKNESPTLELDYDPDRTGVIWDKQKNKPVKIAILKSTHGKYSTSYHFMSPNLKKEYGYVDMTLCTNPKQAYDILGYLDSELFADYPDLKIKGPRVIIDYLQNWNDSRYGAIGRLADKISVKHCLDNGINPVILSVADCDSHVAHYLRGKRFLPLEPESNAFEFFTKKYGSSDVNEILENLIAQSQNSGGKVDLKNWGFTPMYMPGELAQKYVKELQSEKK